MAEHDEFIEDVRLRLEQAQSVTKATYDRSHRPLQLNVGEWVWLCLHHRPYGSLTDAGRGKLRQRFFGPYQITEKINEVAFRLALPPGARLHNVFHVSLRRKYVGQPPQAPPHCRGVRQPLELLVQWEGLPPSSASWDDLTAFQEPYPSFKLEDKLLLKEGSDVMWGQTGAVSFLQA